LLKGIATLYELQNSAASQALITQLSAVVKSNSGSDLSYLLNFDVGELTGNSELTGTTLLE